MLNKPNTALVMLAIVAYVMMACSSGRTITLQMSNAERLTSGNIVVRAGVAQTGGVSYLSVRLGCRGSRKAAYDGLRFTEVIR